MSSIHLDLLDKKRIEIFKKLKIFKKEAILAGGTALLLQVANRYSLDFDLFLERKIERKDFLKLRKAVGIKKVEINLPEQLTIVTNDDVGITLAYYEYRSLFKKIPTISLPLFSLKDIALDKAFTISRRAIWRDYVDLFFLLKWKKINIIDLIKLSQKKFGIEFNPKLFLEQLIFFEDLEVTKISFVKEKYSAEEIKDFLKREVKKFKKLKLRI